MNACRVSSASLAAANSKRAAVVDRGPHRNRGDCDDGGGHGALIEPAARPRHERDQQKDQRAGDIGADPPAEREHAREGQREQGAERDDLGVTAEWPPLRAGCSHASRNGATTMMPVTSPCHQVYQFASSSPDCDPPGRRYSDSTPRSRRWRCSHAATNAKRNTESARRNSRDGRKRCASPSATPASSVLPVAIAAATPERRIDGEVRQQCTDPHSRPDAAPIQQQCGERDSRWWPYRAGIPGRNRKQQGSLRGQEIRDRKHACRDEGAWFQEAS